MKKQVLKDQLLRYQENEITEYHIYRKLAGSLAGSPNARVLEDIAEDERKHYHDWRKHTRQDVGPQRLKVWFYYFVSRIFGLTFGIKLMERGEENAQTQYEKLRPAFPEANRIVEEENDHERALIELLDEERLRYIGSIVLGLNDALVELTGALAGLTFALQNTRLVAVTGLITGLAAAFSMGASEYLSTKTENQNKSPLKASIYTGLAYVATVVLLILPYLLFEHLYLCLALTLSAAAVIIAVFNYYISVAQDLSFRVRFMEMTALSFGVAGISFLIGLAVRSFLGVEV
ncbi:MAG: VIT1/CCC1 transporter family protein [Syntrophotaleaceae bacterium]